MREFFDAIQIKEPGIPLNRMNGAKELIDLFLIEALLQAEDGLLGFIEQVGRFDDEAFQEF